MGDKAQDQYQVPTDAHPQPNASMPEYKMGIGQRILGAANNFLQGMAAHYNHTGMNNMANTGRNAIDESRLQRDQEEWRAKWGPDARKTVLVSGGPSDKAPAEELTYTGNDGTNA